MVLTPVRVVIPERVAQCGRMLRKNANPVLTAHGDGLPIALNAAGQAADWIMLLPAVIATVDGRGPWRVTDAGSLINTSLNAAAGQRLPIDENHSIDHAAPKGGPSPARGWVTALDVRDGAIFGRVEWTEPGAQMLSERAYGFISPVIEVDRVGNIRRLLRASLTNTPNLRGMPALNSEESEMDLLAELRKLLGLADDADAAAVIAKIKAMSEETTTATQAALAPIARAAGLTDTADAQTVLNAVTTLATRQGGNDGAVKELQSELATVTTELNAIKTDRAKDRATALVVGEIGKGRVGVKPLREHYIERATTNYDLVVKELNALPILSPGGALLPATPPDELKDGKVILNAAQQSAAKLLGISEDDYAKTLASERAA